MLQVQKNIALSSKTSLRLGGLAPYWAHVKSEQDLADFVELKTKLDLEFKILGGGSNVLVGDESIFKKAQLPFGIVHINIQQDTVDWNIHRLRNVDIASLPPLAKELAENRDIDNVVESYIPAGMAVPKFIRLCAQKGAFGLQGLVGIPGKVGGAIAMNAGAYYTAMGDVLKSVRIFSQEHGFIDIAQEEFKCTYRSFEPLNSYPDYIICGATFVFPHASTSYIFDLMGQNMEQKKKTQPLNAHTAGCIFKNHVDEHGQTISAGQILDSAGFKGKSRGAMRFSDHHANFLENTGKGKAKDALDLLDEASNYVFEKFGIQLEKEVKIWI